MPCAIISRPIRPSVAWARGTRDAPRARATRTFLPPADACSMAVEELTSGVLAQMLDASSGTAVADPVCQVLSLKKLQTSNASANVSERYRVVLSDGVYYAQGTCAPRPPTH